MSLAVRGATCVAPRTARRGRALLVLRVAPASTASSSMQIEKRFMCRVAHRVRPRELGCPVRKRQSLPLLVVYAPPRKKGNQEQHALNGNTSPSAARSPPRSVRQRVDLANDDDMEPTLVLLRPRRVLRRTGPDILVPTSKLAEGHHQTFLRDAERPLRETFRRELPQMVRHPADQEAGFLHRRWVPVVRRGCPFRGASHG